MTTEDYTIQRPGPIPSPIGATITPSIISSIPDHTGDVNISLAIDIDTHQNQHFGITGFSLFLSGVEYPNYLSYNSEQDLIFRNNSHHHRHCLND